MCIHFNDYSGLITFLSVITGFEITSLSILFNSPLKKALYDRKIKLYRTELHRLRDLYRFSIFLSLLYIFIIMLTPDFNIELCSIGNIDKSLLVLPILMTSMYCIIVLCDDLFRIFVYPTNEK